jgi:hypothetical protein
VGSIGIGFDSERRLIQPLLRGVDTLLDKGVLNKGVLVICIFED